MVKPWVKLSFYSQCDLFLHMNGPSFKLVMFQKGHFNSQRLYWSWSVAGAWADAVPQGSAGRARAHRHRHRNYFRSGRKELYYHCTPQTQDRELPLSTESSRAKGDIRLLNQLCCWQHDSAACHCQAHQSHHRLACRTLCKHILKAKSYSEVWSFSQT